MKKFFKDLDPKWKTYAVAGCCCILFYVVLAHLGQVLGAIGSFLTVFKTVFIGAVIAYIINPLAVYFEKKVFKNMKKDKSRWILSVVIAFVIILLLLALLSYAVFPQIVRNVASLISNLDNYVANLKDFANNLSGRFGPEIKDWVESFTAEDTGMLGKIINWLSDNLNVIISTTSKMGSAVASWAIGAIFALYFLLAKDSVKKVFVNLFKLLLNNHNYSQFIDLANRFHQIFSKYIIFEIIDALIIGVLTYVFMLITKMPDAAFISLIAAVTNLIPTFGPIIGIAIAGFVLLLIQPSALIAYVIFAAIIQLADSYVIKPKLFGDALNVPGVLILVAVIIFGNLLGVTGMLIAIPIAAILVYIYTDLFIPWLELKKDLKDFNKE